MTEQERAKAELAEYRDAAYERLHALCGTRADAPNWADIACLLRERQELTRHAQQPLSTLREALEPCKVEHKKFEEWAVTQHYDMHEHPLHYLFLDTKTSAARMGWNAALDYVTQTLASTPDQAAEKTDGGAS